MRSSRHCKKLPLALALLLPALALTPTGQAQGRRIKDTLVLASGESIQKVEVLSMTIAKVTYKKSGKEVIVPSNKLLSIQWHNAPEAMTRAESALRRGQFENAANLYLAAAKETKREVIQLQVKFFAARALAKLAAMDRKQAGAAQTAAKTYLAASKDGFYVPEARLIEAEMMTLQGKPAEAIKLLNAMDGDAIAQSWPLKWTAYAKTSLAQAQSSLGQHSKARSSYNQVVSAVESALGDTNANNHSLLNLKISALVQVGETYIAEKFYDDALKHFRNLASDGGKGLMAAAKAGEGQILYLQAKKEGQDGLLRQAQIALAQASVEPGSSAADAAKALYFMAKVLTALGDEKEADALVRAKSYYQSIRSTYPGTPWASLAADELNQ